VLHPETMIVVGVAAEGRGEGVERDLRPAIPDGVHGDSETAADDGGNLRLKTLEGDTEGDIPAAYPPLYRRQHAAVSKQLDRADSEPGVTFAGGGTVESCRIEGAQERLGMRHHQHADRETPLAR